MIAFDGFAIDPFAVTVHRFERFVESTGHVTAAERAGWSLVSSSASRPRQVIGASWRAPDGPGSLARPDHPVVHVSHNDALAFCAWAGTRLPTEREWVSAAGELPLNGFHGFSGTVPVDAYEPNELGLHNVFGNVWEWCAERATLGGSYTFDAARCAPDTTKGNLGFRCAN